MLPEKLQIGFTEIPNEVMVRCLLRNWIISSSTELEMLIFSRFRTLIICESGALNATVGLTGPNLFQVEVVVSFLDWAGVGEVIIITDN